jgi:hypothetical protein
MNEKALIVFGEKKITEKKKERERKEEEEEEEEKEERGREKENADPVLSFSGCTFSILESKGIEGGVMS